MLNYKMDFNLYKKNNKGANSRLPDYKKIGFVNVQQKNFYTIGRIFKMINIGGTIVALLFIAKYFWGF